MIESVSVQSFIGSPIKLIFRVINESVSITESFSKARNLGRFINETISISDSPLARIIRRIIKAFGVDAYIGKVITSELDFESVMIEIYDDESVILDIFDKETVIKDVIEFESVRL